MKVAGYILAGLLFIATATVEIVPAWNTSVYQSVFNSLVGMLVILAPSIGSVFREARGIDRRKK